MVDEPINVAVRAHKPEAILSRFRPIREDEKAQHPGVDYMMEQVLVVFDIPNGLPETYVKTEPTEYRGQGMMVQR